MKSKSRSVVAVMFSILVTALYPVMLRLGHAYLRFRIWKLHTMAVFWRWVALHAPVWMIDFLVTKVSKFERMQLTRRERPFAAVLSELNCRAQLTPTRQGTARIIYSDLRYFRPSQLYLHNVPWNADSLAQHSLALLSSLFGWPAGAKLIELSLTWVHSSGYYELDLRPVFSAGTGIDSCSKGSSVDVGPPSYEARIYGHDGATMLTREEAQWTLVPFGILDLYLLDPASDSGLGSGSGLSNTPDSEPTFAELEAALAATE